MVLDDIKFYKIKELEFKYNELLRDGVDIQYSGTTYKLDLSKDAMSFFGTYVTSLQNDKTTKSNGIIIDIYGNVYSLPINDIVVIYQLCLSKMASMYEDTFYIKYNIINNILEEDFETIDEAIAIVTVVETADPDIIVPIEEFSKKIKKK